MKVKILTLTSGWVAFVATMAVAAATGTYSPIANLTEHWTNAANWSANAGGSGMNAGFSNGCEVIKSPVLNQPLPGWAYVAGDGAASGGRFVGNYSNSAIACITFRLMRRGCANATFLFVTDTGETWGYPFALPSQEGQWLDVVIPMTYSASWKGYGSVAEFDAAKTHIANLWIYAERSGSGEQFVMIDDLKAVGPWEKGPMIGDVPQYWLRENGLPEQTGQDIADFDGDGFNNYAEYMAGTDPKNNQDTFRIEIGNSEGNQPVLRWKHANYRSYTVLRSDNLTQANSFATCTNVADGVVTVNAAAKSEVVLNNETAQGASFYKVAIQQQ